MNTTPHIAYFSMEYAFSKDIPNYAGGLGVLAADTMYSCADLGVDIIGLSLIYHQDDDKALAFDPSKHMEQIKAETHVSIEGREVQIVIWKMDIKGKNGHIVPVLFLSTNHPDNPQWDRDITKYLYSSDEYLRLGQEVVLGIGGIRALKKLGYDNITNYHMNEGHSAFLTLDLLREHQNNQDKVKSMCTFTTHTPIAAGHDYFNYDLVYRTIPELIPKNIKELTTPQQLGMTQLALSLSKISNSVTERHKLICNEMFPNYEFENVTNGVYHPRWIGDHMKQLLDSNLPGWEEDPSILLKAPDLLKDEDVENARKKQKKELIDWINSTPDFFPFGEIDHDDHFDEETLTISFARRFVPYKRVDLIFNNLELFREIGYKKIQLIFSGKCHKEDAFCTNLLAKIKTTALTLRGQVRIAVVPDYNIEISKRLISGSDVWLNNPIPPLEASGTSGMKAALNGVLNLSVLDGWWIEGYKQDHMSGWAFGENSANGADQNKKDARELYVKLKEVIDCYYTKKPEWTNRVKHAISLLSFFNTHRLVREYMEKIWK